MINIVVVTHGNLAGELVNSAKMIVGESEAVFCVSLQPEDSPEMFSEKFDTVMARLQGQETLVLIDMFSGTPSNIAASQVMQENIECVTGVNLPMLLEAVLARKDTNLHELAGLIAESGFQSIKNLKPMFK